MKLLVALMLSLMMAYSITVSAQLPYCDPNFPFFCSIPPIPCDPSSPFCFTPPPAPPPVPPPVEVKCTATFQQNTQTSQVIITQIPTTVIGKVICPQPFPITFEFK